MGQVNPMGLASRPTGTLNPVGLLASPNGMMGRWVWSKLQGISGSGNRGLWVGGPQVLGGAVSRVVPREPREPPHPKTHWDHLTLRTSTSENPLGLLKLNSP